MNKINQKLKIIELLTKYGRMNKCGVSVEGNIISVQYHDLKRKYIECTIGKTSSQIKVYGETKKQKYENSELIDKIESYLKRGV